MANSTELIINPETGYYTYPERPAELPDESEYPREYSIKNFTQKEISDFTYHRSIRGFSTNRMEKGEVNVLSKDGVLEAKPGWIPSESGLIFRSLAIGLVKLTEWIVIERNTGISLMPEMLIENKEPEDLQLSFDFISKPGKAVKDKWFHSDRKATGSNRKKAIELAEMHVKYFSKEEWIEIDRKISYSLAGLEYDIIRTPEQERIESEWADACKVVGEANDLKMKTNNFYAIYKGLKIYEHSEDQTKMTDWNKVESSIEFRIAEKINHKKKAKFFYAQEDYGHNIEVEGVILPIEIKGLPEMRELVIVKGDQFKNTRAVEIHTETKYSVYEPYLGIAITKNVNTLKAAREEAIERLTLRVTPKGVKSLNTRIQEHHEKIIAAQSSQDITPFLQLDTEKEEKQAA